MSERLIQHSRVIRELGSGSAGVVYQAQDERLMRTVVLKMLHASEAQSEATSRLLREARIASSIDHPNVCSIYEVGESAEGPFIVMQYVAGRTLQRMVQQDGALDVFVALSVAMQAAEGLNAAHEIGILHRDLKPANLMVTDAGLVKLLDFGLATRRRRVAGQSQLERDTSAGPFASRHNLGTTAYMAPELFVTFESTEQSDIYSLGVMLYEMVTGRHPFWVPGLDQVQLEQAIQFQEAFRVSALRKSLAPSLEGVIQRAMAKHPSQRFESVRQMRDGLRSVLRALRVDQGADPEDESASIPPAAGQGGAEARPSSFFSQVVARLFRPPTKVLPLDTFVVAPFRAIDDASAARRWGRVLAEATAARLADVRGLRVKATDTLALTRGGDVFAEARRLGCGHVITGSYALLADGLSLSWQVIAVETQQIQAGTTLFLESLELATVEEELAEAVYAALRTESFWQTQPVAAWDPAHEALPSEAYLDARALLTKFAVRSSRREDLSNATQMLQVVLASEPHSARAHSALGIAHYYAVRVGFSGKEALIEGQRALERAVELDPELLEAQTYLTYTLLWRGKKREVRDAVQSLLTRAPRSADVHALAGIVLRLDGLYQESLAAFSKALVANPADAASLFNHRSRVYQYLNRPDMARLEVERGLRLDAGHSLLRTSLSYLDYRDGHLERAEVRLKEVIAKDDGFRLANVVLAMIYAREKRSEEARAQLSQEVLAVADADSEMAYRVATFFAIEGRTEPALTWLRRSIYLGNENYPWMAANESWDALRSNKAFQEVLSELRSAYRANSAQWRRLAARGRAVKG